MTRLLNFGCGNIQLDGWVNVDIQDFGQDHVADVFDGLPFDDGTFDGAIADHVLQEFTWHDLPRVAAELHRVMATDGLLRVAVPDWRAAVGAYERLDRSWFPIGDDIPDLDRAFCAYVNWFSTTRSFFTRRYLIDLLRTAGFREAVVSDYGRGVLDEDGLELWRHDSRRAEQPIIVEARK